jgi:CubicO group peptidase (beta-lactamase class C family)
LAGIQRFISFSDSIFKSSIEEQLTLGGAVALVKDTSSYIEGFGFSNIDSNTRVTPKATRFQLGSIGKLFTAIAVLLLVEQGKVNLNDEVNNYLHSFKIEPYASTPITLRHLLTHTAGINDRVIGYATLSDNEIEPLGKHLARRFPMPYTSPGTEISYSNYAYGLAGYVVQEVSGVSFTEYIEQHILRPLEMQNTTYQVEQSESKYARGYKSDGKKFIPVDSFFRHVIPAGSIISTAEDMSHLLQMFLQEGQWKENRILSKHSIDQMFSRQFSNHPKLTGYTLGFEEQNFNGTFAVAKGGQIPGFNAVVCIIPENNLGIFTVVNSSSDQALQNYFDAIRSQLFPEDKKSLNAAVSMNLDEFTGEYRSNRYNRNTIEKLPAMMYSLKKVYLKNDSTLALYHDGRYQYYIPMDSLVFVNKNDPHRYLIFERNEAGDITRMYHNTYISGIQVPVAYEKLAWYESNAFINEQFPVIIVFLLTYLLYPLIYGISYLIRRIRPNFWRAKSLPKGANIMGFLFAVLTAVYLVYYFLGLIDLGIEVMLGLPDYLYYLHLIPFLFIIGTLFMIFYAWSTWRMTGYSILSRIYFSVYTLCAVLWIWFLNYWNFIGFHI